jgi:hypothetical protein
MFDLDIAMRNSYDIIVNKLSLDNFKEGNNSYFIHNPKEEVTLETLQDMKTYFRSIGEWNKTLKVTTLIAKLKYYDTVKRLSKTYSRQGD